MSAARRIAASLLAPVLFGALAVPPAAGQDAVIPGVFLVKNNTGAHLRCRYRRPGGEWSRYFRFRPGAEFERPALPFTTLHFFCESPARRIVYAVSPGGRHAMLRAADGSVVMREIATR